MAQTDVLNRNTIAAYFEDSNDARKAVDALQDAGFTSAHLGIAHRGQYAGESTISGTTRTHGADHDGPSTWDKIKSWFSGDEPEPYANERAQDDFSRREVTSNTDNLYGDYDETADLGGSFTAMEIPQDRARYFSHRLGRSDNGAVVTVQAGTRREEAEEILTRYNADFGANAAGYDYSEQTGEYTGDNTRNAETQNIQLLGEVLRVHKDRINRGEVRIRKEVVTENQNIQVPVQREELVIERRAVGENTPATDSIGEKEIRVPLSEERATVSKSAVVREEVKVGKKPVEEVRDLNAEVQHEELVVDDETKRRRTA
jgi:uncharacterized protein (TIGR02271 family)